MRLEIPWSSPEHYIQTLQPDEPQMFFDPEILQQTARRFQRGFPGLVTYAVKANPELSVLSNLVAAGINSFDVASPQEMALVRATDAMAVLHYNNPVRSMAEVVQAKDFAVASASIDCLSELNKLSILPKETEISVRFALPVTGAAYNFGSKFGATPDAAVALLRAVVERGFRPALTFHPGTQCAAPAAWQSYIQVAANIAERAGVTIERLNVGGGFASHRDGMAPDLEQIFDRIGATTNSAFKVPPLLVCEPGRAMVAEAFTLCTRVKALRPDGSIFLNDGIYGAMAEMRDISALERVRCIAPAARSAQTKRRVVFGPSCDSLDRLPEPVALPEDIQEGDHVVFDGMGAYSLTLATRFNGYGGLQVITVGALDSSKAGQERLSG